MMNTENSKEDLLEFDFIDYEGSNQKQTIN